jgi:hypothetical protein
MCFYPAAMKKTSSKKQLRLASETVRVLQTSKLSFVNGGASLTCLAETTKQGQMSCGKYCEEKPE